MTPSTPQPTEFDEEVPLATVTDAAAATAAGSVVRNSVWSTLGMILPQAYTLAGSVLIARFLGAASVGRVSFIALVQATLIMLFAQGLPKALLRYTGETVGRGDAGAVRDLANLFTRIGAATGLLCGVGMAAVGALGSTPRGAWVFAGVAAAAMITQSFPNAFLLGIQRWNTATLAGLIPASIGMAFKIAWLIGGGGITGLFGVDAAMALVTLGASSLLARRHLRHLGTGRHVDRVLRARALRFGLITSLGIIVTLVVWRRTEVFFLAHYSSDTEIALYSVPFSAMTALLIVPQAASATLSPAFATLFGAGATDRIANGFARSIRLITLMSVGLAALTIACGGELIRLVYGPAFQGAGRVIVILALPVPLVSLLYTCLAILLGLGRQWVPILTDSIAAVFNLGLDWLFIPGHGAVGAAVANACAQALGSIPILIYTTRLIGGSPWTLRGTGGAFGAGTAAAICGWFVVHMLGGIVGVTAGLLVTVAVGGAVLRLLGAVGAEDAAWLQAVVAAPLRRRFAG